MSHCLLAASPGRRDNFFRGRTIEQSNEFGLHPSTTLAGASPQGPRMPRTRAQAGLNQEDVHGSRPAQAPQRATPCLSFAHAHHHTTGTGAEVLAHLKA